MADIDALLGGATLSDIMNADDRAAVEKAGVGAYYVFDRETQDAVIMAPVPGKSTPLSAWATAQ